RSSRRGSSQARQTRSSRRLSIRQPPSAPSAQASTSRSASSRVRSPASALGSWAASTSAVERAEPAPSSIRQFEASSQEAGAPRRGLSAPRPARAAPGPSAPRRSGGPRERPRHSTRGPPPSRGGARHRARGRGPRESPPSRGAPPRPPAGGSRRPSGARLLVRRARGVRARGPWRDASYHGSGRGRGRGTLPRGGGMRYRLAPDEGSAERLRAQAGRYWNAHPIAVDSVDFTPGSRESFEAIYARWRETIDEHRERFLESCRGRRVLEVGCGTARDGRFLIENGIDYRAVDASRRSLALAREHFSQQGLPARFTNAHATALPFADG